MLTPKRLAAALRDSPPKTTASTTACEDHRKAPSPPPPSRGGNHESELKRFGNPPVDSVRSDTALRALVQSHMLETSVPAMRESPQRQAYPVLRADSDQVVS